MRFIILSQARQGSTLLQTILNSHSQIKFEGELFQDKSMIKRFGKPISQLVKHHFSLSYINFLASHSNKEHWGFKLILNQVPDPLEFIKNAHESGYELIDLRRHNGIEVALSACIASKSGKWFMNNSREQHQNPIYIEPELFLMRLTHYEEQIALQNELIKNKNHFRVSYEDDLKTPEKRVEFCKRFCDHFKIPREDMQGVTIPSDEKKYHERVSNYNELIEHIKLTRFKYLL